MSNDLISRSAFVKEINEHMKNVYECDIESVFDFQDDNKSEESYIVQGLFEAFELISNVPTAYNVDKVVERLRKEISDCMCDECDRHTDCDTCRAEKAVEIVKSGGIE